MADQPTCGQGLVEHSVLTAKLGELTAAVAEILAIHATALDLDDANARAEHDVYLRLVKQHRDTAAQLRATADEMAGQENLPMGNHDIEVVSSPSAVAAFVTFVTVERELVTLLQGRLEQDQQMLDTMNGGGEASSPPE